VRALLTIGDLTFLTFNLGRAKLSRRQHYLKFVAIRQHAKTTTCQASTAPLPNRYVILPVAYLMPVTGCLHFVAVISVV